VIVGGGTLRHEDYGPVRFQPAGAAWRGAHGRDPEVPVVVVSRTGDLGSGRVLEGPTLVTGRDLPLDPAAMVAALHERGLTRLLCEGGPTLLTSLVEAGLVTDLCLTSTHLLVGDWPPLVGSLTRPTELRLETLVHDEPGVLLARWSVVPGCSVDVDT
jgi:riboflavin biosynthesis pyrimidine reductase